LGERSFLEKKRYPIILQDSPKKTENTEAVQRGPPAPLRSLAQAYNGKNEVGTSVSNRLPDKESKGAKCSSKWPALNDAGPRSEKNEEPRRVLREIDNVADMQTRPIYKKGRQEREDYIKVYLTG